jgi:hypothetical protein
LPAKAKKLAGDGILGIRLFCGCGFPRERYELARSFLFSCLGAATVSEELLTLSLKNWQRFVAAAEVKSQL